jgi:hypothetical protein
MLPDGVRHPDRVDVGGDVVDAEDVGAEEDGG